MFLDQYKAFIFDMDGVLVDSENLYKAIENRLFLDVGIRMDPLEHVSYQGSSNPVMWARIKEKYGLGQSLQELVDKTEKTVIEYFSSLPHIEPMPGVVELLQLLQEKKTKIALASSSTIDVIRIILDKTGLVDFFEVIAESLEAGAGKPDPAIFLLAQRKLGIPKENCLIIEDSTNGIKAAQAAGIYCIAFNGPGSEHQDQSEANWRISTFTEIVMKINDIS